MLRIDLYQKLMALLLSGPAAMAGEILCLLGLIWCFSPAPLPFALVVLLSGCGLLVLAGYSLHRDRVLVQNGYSVTGYAVTVKRSMTKINLGMSTLEPSIHPYRITYRYTVDGIEYRGRSRLLWGPPTLPENRHIPVYLDPKKPTRSALDFPIV